MENGLKSVSLKPNFHHNTNALVKRGDLYVVLDICGAFKKLYFVILVR